MMAEDDEKEINVNGYRWTDVTDSPTFQVGSCGSPMLTPGTTAEYGRTQERCEILQIEGGRALVRFDDRQEWVNKKMLAWLPSEAEIAAEAERMKPWREE